MRTRAATGMRGVLYALPLATVLLVCFALFVVGKPRPYSGARVYGGPTERAERLSFRVEVLERLQEYEAPLAGRAITIRVQTRAGTHSSRVIVDAEGSGHVSFPLGPHMAGPVRLDVAFEGDGETKLVAGNISLSAGEWSRSAKRIGGWLTGRRSGALRVSVAAARGVFAVPFADPVWIRVEGNEGPVRGARVRLEGEGIRIESPARATAAVTNARGYAQVAIRPLEHAVALRVAAETDATPEGLRRGEWYATLPIVPGALHVEQKGEALLLTSPIARERAYFAVIGEESRLFSGTAEMRPDGRGGATATVQLPALTTKPVWAMVSSEAPLNSPSAVGWPLTVGEPDDQPPATWTVPDRLLLDGMVQAYERDRERKARARLLAGVISATGALLAAVLLYRSVRGSEFELQARLREAELGETLERALPRRQGAWALLIAVLCIALGFAVVALVVVYRIE